MLIVGESFSYFKVEDVIFDKREVTCDVQLSAWHPDSINVSQLKHTIGSNVVLLSTEQFNKLDTAYKELTALKNILKEKHNVR